MVNIARNPRRRKGRKREGDGTEDKAEHPEWLDWTPDDSRRALEAPDGEAPVPAAEATPAERILMEEDKLFAKSKYHILTHTPASIHCEGCRAKTRHKSHYRGTSIAMTAKTLLQCIN